MGKVWKKLSKILEKTSNFQENLGKISEIF